MHVTLSHTQLAVSGTVNGERRSFALLRPSVDATAQDRLRDVVLAAYAEHETELAASA